VDQLRVGTVGPISCEVHAGEIVGLVGLRGAGQEAVGRTLFGLRRPSAGRIVIDGADTLVSSPRAAMEAGVNLVCGDRVGESILPSLAVRENMFLNPLAAGKAPLAWLDPGAEVEAARRLGERVGLRPNDPRLAIELLSGGNQQKVVVGRWLNLSAKIYVFEDPTAGVDVGAKAEIYRLFDVALQAGAAIIIVSTDFEEVAKVCHRAIVFDRGAVVNELAAEDLSIGNLLAAASANIPRKYPTEAVPGSASGAPHAVH
jgi:ribose transport system ATP-binding protein